MHVDEGNNNENSELFFDNATTNKVKYDVIGLSVSIGLKDYTGSLPTLNLIPKRYG
jgi:arabinogalactan endo-1,4-beta-galactosidase